MLSAQLPHKSFSTRAAPTQRVSVSSAERFGSLRLLLVLRSQFASGQAEPSDQFDVN